MMDGFDRYNKRQHLSISSLVNYARCPRRFFYNSGVRLKRDDEDHVALLFGECMHAALPVVLTKGLEEGIEVFAKLWDESRADNKRNFHKARLMLANFEYVHKGDRSIYTLQEPPGGAVNITDRVSDYEIPFAIDIGLDVPLVGRVDGLCLHRDTKDLWALEFKTSQEVSARFFDAFTFAAQPLGYTLALRSMGVDVRGCCVEAIRVSSTERVETLPQFIPVEDHQLDDFLTWARWIGSQILECEKLGEFPKNPAGCSSYPMFGQPGFVCEYQPLCTIKNWTDLESTYYKGEDRPFTVATVEGKEPS